MLQFPARSACALAATLLLAASAAAQAPTTFDVVKGPSNFQWSGNTSLGQIVGNPDDTFKVDGIVEMLVDPAGGPFTSATFAGGFSYTIPAKLSGKIPNPLPFLPPLAVIDILDVALKVDSAQFSVDPVTGAFTTLVTITMLHGTTVVSPLVGSQTVIPLAGSASDPTSVSGTLKLNGSQAELTVPIAATFDLSDPNLTATVDLTGTVVAVHMLADPPTVLEVGALAAGAGGSFSVVDGTPGTPLFLAYSLAGPGTTTVAQLGIDLDLASPKQAGGAVQTDASGAVSWSLPIPGNAAGVTAWFQAAQNGRTSNVVVTTIN